MTAPDRPFYTRKHANTAKAVFEAFRQKGLAIAVYFSKPDWHCPWYWAEVQENGGLRVHLPKKQTGACPLAPAFRLE